MKCLENVPNSLAAILLGIVVSSHYNVVNGAVPVRSRDFSNQNTLEPITLEDVLSYSFSGRGFNGQWMEGSDNLIRIFSQNGIINFNVLNNQTSLVLNYTDITEHLLQMPFSGVTFSNDGKYALIEHSRSNLWRYSSLAKYHIFDLQTKSFTPLVPPSEAKDKELLRLVKWSPNGNGIAFVSHNYNIYYRKNASPSTAVRQITADGDEEKAIYNGIADWVYEEEMFGGPTAFWISEDGSNLAFVKFNDAKVTEFQWPIYGEPGSENSVYPEYRKLRYPKAGTENPEADVYVVSLTDDSSAPRKLLYPQTNVKDLHLIGTVLWANSNSLLVATLNREQTVSQWHFCTASECKIIYTYELSHGWVDMNTPKASKDGSKFVFVRSQIQDSGLESYYHIIMFRVDGTSTVLTKGRLSVVDILGWDEPNGKIFFTGSFWNGTHADPSETHVYSVGDNGENPVPKCITCGLKNSFNMSCRENSAKLSVKYTHFIHRCGGPDVPEDTTRFTKTGEVVAFPGPTAVKNTVVRENLAKKAVPITREYSIPVGDKSQGFMARARLYLPPNYDSTKKYPLLISVYGGPGSQNLKQTYAITWETSLVSGKNIIFGNIDGRGTAKQSTDHLFTLHRSLGTYEIEDQITAVKWLVENEPLIDANKTSIWGWSYGGYATAKVLEKDTENVFKCGMAVAPVTSWRYYDTIYTERYMGLPTKQDNLKGYNDSDVTTHVENLRNKQFMMIHGNADDNVHYQQSMILSRALEQNDIFFHQLSYPDENHAINGPGMKKHLYHSLERFLFKDCFGSTDSPSRNGRDSGASSLANSFVIVLLTCIFLISRHHVF